MNKSAIQKFAVNARRDLIEQVKQQAFNYGIDKNGCGDKNAISVNGSVISNEKKLQRMALITAIEKDGYEQVIEKVAYTWFNRFIAIRFMEVNDYLPTHIRVFSDETGAFKPEILKYATTIELVNKNGENLIDKERVNELLENPEGTEDLYRYLLLTQCKSLHYLLPKMFDSISTNDFTELLLPLKILSDESVIAHLVNDIDEEDFKEAVEIIGWLYQYYNTEPKSAIEKQSIKIMKEQIPAATQLFTPDWIVRYMVENSLGRIYIDKSKNEGIFGDGRGSDEMTWQEIEAKRISNEKYIAEKMNWKYYLPEAEQTQEIQEQLQVINDSKINFKLEELKVIDPCMGSGHILVYAFDVLMQMYETQGFTSKDAVMSIMQNNLFGLDIDERAYQLSYFALMMKARANDRRFLTREISPQVYCPKGYADGEEYGSLLNVDELEAMPKEKGEITLFEESYEQQLNAWNFRRLLHQKYDVVVTNPPYKSSADLNIQLNKYIKKNYFDSKADLFAAFIEQSLYLSKEAAYVGMITMHSWMFLSGYEKLRLKLLNNDIVNMAHLGARAFEEIGGEVVQTTSWIMRKSNINGYKGVYKRLVDFSSQASKEEAFLTDKHIYISIQEKFSKIKGTPIVYWAKNNTIKVFESNKSISSFCDARQGLATGNNDKFVRNWSEIDFRKIGFNNKKYEEFVESGKKYVPYIKSNGFSKWYGNYYTVLKFDEVNYKLLLNSGNHLPSRQYYFRENFNWSLISTDKFGARIADFGGVFDVGAHAIYTSENIYRYGAYLNSKVFNYLIKFLSPTLNYNSGIVAIMPCNNFSCEKVEKLTAVNISISKSDWNELEISWDFVRHPLVNMEVRNLKNNKMGEKEDRIAWNFEYWVNICMDRFNKLKVNEEELNRIFIDIYGLQDELTPEVEDKDVTIRLADKTRDIKSFISYAVGCMFGRYSLDVDGLAYAGGEFDNSKYTSFIPDADNIIPICDDEYFEDDIVGRFIKFVEVVYGTGTLEENLAFIASALSTKGTAREIIRNYFINGFYADHCKVYSKRPIYWQFDSGKKNGFKALIYMHRYESNLLARMRTDYVHEQQERYRTQIAHIEDMLVTASNKDKVALIKRSKKLVEQAQEILKFEEKIHHLADKKISIDLDDGVVKNYALFDDVVTKIK